MPDLVIFGVPQDSIQRRRILMKDTLRKVTAANQALAITDKQVTVKLVACTDDDEEQVEILVFVTLDKKEERTLEVQNALAAEIYKVILLNYPGALCEVFMQPFDHAKHGFAGPGTV